MRRAIEICQVIMKNGLTLNEILDSARAAGLDLSERESVDMLENLREQMRSFRIMSDVDTDNVEPFFAYSSEAAEKTKL